MDWGSWGVARSEKGPPTLSVHRKRLGSAAGPGSAGEGPGRRSVRLRRPRGATTRPPPPAPRLGEGLYPDPGQRHSPDQPHLLLDAVHLVSASRTASFALTARPLTDLHCGPSRDGSVHPQQTPPHGLPTCCLGRVSLGTEGPSLTVCVPRGRLPSEASGTEPGTGSVSSPGLSKKRERPEALGSSETSGKVDSRFTEAPGLGVVASWRLSAPAAPSPTAQKLALSESCSCGGGCQHRDTQRGDQVGREENGALLKAEPFPLTLQFHSFSRATCPQTSFIPEALMAQSRPLAWKQAITQPTQHSLPARRHTGPPHGQQHGQPPNPQALRVSLGVHVNRVHLGRQTLGGPQPPPPGSPSPASMGHSGRLPTSMGQCGPCRLCLEPAHPVPPREAQLQGAVGRIWRLGTRSDTRPPARTTLDEEGTLGPSAVDFQGASWKGCPETTAARPKGLQGRCPPPSVLRPRFCGSFGGLGAQRTPGCGPSLSRPGGSAGAPQPPALSAVLTGPPAARQRSVRLPNPQGLSRPCTLPEAVLGWQQDCLGRVRWAPAGPHTSNWRVTKEHGQRTGRGSLSPTPVPVSGGGRGLPPQLGLHQGPSTLLPERRFIWHLDEMVLTAS
ncbi:unnamed protein product [Rangifer tarandus platyrhynchus]|uniref:Collagen alpha-1(I) chain-like n=1 Tax=Rangifer tarandus platyrhynchus TaxID=3082113 RepID=A0ABN8Y7B0_RANTA|nr:unnamed protein product [Rangifer tarandus platyrhynchus]